MKSLILTTLEGILSSIKKRKHIHMLYQQYIDEFCASS